MIFGIFDRSSVLIRGSTSAEARSCEGLNKQPPAMRALLVALAAALLSVVRAPPCPIPALASVEANLRCFSPPTSSRFQLFGLSGWVCAPRANPCVAVQGQLPSTEAKGYYNVGYGRTYY